MTYRTYITIIKNEKEFNQSICTDDFIDTVKILRENNEVSKITICCITTQEIDQETILDLMDKAYLVGFDIHKLCDMIRAGKTEGQCYSAIAKNIRITFEDQGFLMVDDHDYSN